METKRWKQWRDINDCVTEFFTFDPSLGRDLFVLRLAGVSLLEKVEAPRPHEETNEGKKPSRWRFINVWKNSNVSSSCCIFGLSVSLFISHCELEKWGCTNPVARKAITS